MRRERQVINDRITALYLQEQKEYYPGCNYMSIQNKYSPLYNALYTELASTYNMTLSDYQEREMVIDKLLYSCNPIAEEINNYKHYINLVDMPEYDD